MAGIHATRQVKPDTNHWTIKNLLIPADFRSAHVNLILQQMFDHDLHSARTLIKQLRCGTLRSDQYHELASEVLARYTLEDFWFRLYKILPDSFCGCSVLLQAIPEVSINNGCKMLAICSFILSR